MARRVGSLSTLHKWYARGDAQTALASWHNSGVAPKIQPCSVVGVLLHGTEQHSYTCVQYLSSRGGAD